MKSIRHFWFLPLLLTGCGWTIIPPPPAAEPRAVYVSDYGRHTRVALQTSATSMTEYGFGDWRFYAEGDKSLRSGIVALTTPTQAALGRRTLTFTDDPDRFIASAGAERAERLEIDRHRVAGLVSYLDHRYRSNIQTEIRSQETGFTYVQDALPYQISHNSNHQAADWLERLGCEIDGNPTFSNFRVVRRAGSR